jgi:hypothetical protein
MEQKRKKDEIDGSNSTEIEEPGQRVNISGGDIDRGPDLESFSAVLTSHDYLKKTPDRHETTSIDGKIKLAKGLSVKQILKDGEKEIASAREVGLQNYSVPKSITLFRGDTEIIEARGGNPTSWNTNNSNDQSNSTNRC